MFVDDESAHLSIQVPMQKNERLQAADRDTKLGLDGEGTLEEVFVIGPFRRHEALDINIGQRWRSSCVDFVFRFSVQSTRAVIELGKGAKGKYEIDGT